MTVESLKADMASGSVPVVIDVRRPDEFASGHVRTLPNFFSQPDVINITSMQ